MKVQLKDRAIPHRPDAYPNFTKLGAVVPVSPEAGSLLSVFSAEEVVELVNRCIYQLEYQRDSHKKHQDRQQEFERPIKEALKTLYPGTSWAKATPEQIEHAMQVAYPTGKKKEDK